MYNKLVNSEEQSGENVLFSPFSISTALAMTYEGRWFDCGGDENVLYYPLDDLVRRSSFARMFNLLKESASKGDYELSVSNIFGMKKHISSKKVFMMCLIVIIMLSQLLWIFLTIRGTKRVD